MRETGERIGGELFLGAVYGLGMSIAVWIPLNTGTLTDAGVVLLCLVAAAAGLSRSWCGWPAPAALSWVAAAWLVGGPAPAILVGVFSAAGSRLISGRHWAAARLAFDSGAAALAVAAAAGVAQRVSASLIVFVVSYVAVSIALHTLRRQFAGIALARVGRDLLVGLSVSGVGLAGALGIAWVWAQPTYRLLLLIAPALRLGWLAHAGWAAARRRRGRSGHPVAAERLRDQAAAALAQAQPEGSAGGHLWRTAALCSTIAQRLGSDPDELRYLNHAALLHHSGRLAHRDEQIEVHPRVVEEVVSQLGFATPVRTVLREMHEHWNGQGPFGLRGERINRGARILAVADEYDRALHGARTSRRHASAMTALRCEGGKRFDPLMLEILDELADKLEATGGDLTRRFDLASSHALAGSRIVDAERDLQTLYTIQRAAELPIGLRERCTLIAGLLRQVVPFSQLRIESADEPGFSYGDHTAGPVTTTFPLIHAGETCGRLVLSFEHDQTLDEPRRQRLLRVVPILAQTLAREQAAQHAVSLTDASTGLPNARYLRRIVALRTPTAGHSGPGFGLLALHVRPTGGGTPVAEPTLKIVARQLAAVCGTHETLVRFGPEQFIVVTQESRGGELVRRWHQLIDYALSQPLMIDGQATHLRLDGAHASHPLDGEQLSELLASLEARLTCRGSASVVPFPTRHTG